MDGECCSKTSTSGSRSSGLLKGGIIYKPRNNALISVLLMAASRL